MHPLVAKWIEADRHYDEVVRAARKARDEAWKAARQARPDRARLRRAEPSDVRVGAILWYHHTRDIDGPCDFHTWLRVDVANDPEGGAFQADGANYPYLDFLYVEDEPPLPAA